MARAQYHKIFNLCRRGLPQFNSIYLLILLSRLPSSHALEVISTIYSLFPILAILTALDSGQLYYKTLSRPTALDNLLAPRLFADYIFRLISLNASITLLFILVLFALRPIESTFETLACLLLFSFSFTLFDEYQRYLQYFSKQDIWLGIQTKRSLLLYTLDSFFFFTFPFPIFFVASRLLLSILLIPSPLVKATCRLASIYIQNSGHFLRRFILTLPQLSLYALPSNLSILFERIDRPLVLALNPSLLPFYLFLSSFVQALSLLFDTIFVLPIRHGLISSRSKPYSISRVPLLFFVVFATLTTLVVLFIANDFNLAVFIILLASIINAFPSDIINEVLFRNSLPRKQLLCTSIAFLFLAILLLIHLLVSNFYPGTLGSFSNAAALAYLFSTVLRLTFLYRATNSHALS